MNKIGRNNPCPCGSGKKYKKCCLDLASTENLHNHSAEQKSIGKPVFYHDTFKFDGQACLTECDGACCKNRTYLQISYTDIFLILSSKAADYLNIKSTIELFDKKSKLLNLLYDPKHNIHLPYIDFSAEGARKYVKSKNAAKNKCPFLYPIKEVYSVNNMDIETRFSATPNSMGCILMENKPIICRLSPIGLCRGMTTGQLTFEYMKPARICPACSSDNEVELSSYLNKILPLETNYDQSLVHYMLMEHNKRIANRKDQTRFQEILNRFYNIDNVIYSLKINKRPSFHNIMCILISAAFGDFNLYTLFINNQIQEEDYSDYYERIKKKIPKFKYSFISKIHDFIPDLHNKHLIRPPGDDYLMILFEIEKGINEVFKFYNTLTDKIVANVLTEQIFLNEDQAYDIFYSSIEEQNLHSLTKKHLESLNIMNKFTTGSATSAFADVILKIKAYLLEKSSKDKYLKDNRDFFNRG